MDILKHIQLVHLRQGWTWTQNLWNPSDITYMTAPVTRFSPDVLAGALFLIGALFSFRGGNSCVNIFVFSVDLFARIV